MNDNRMKLWMDAIDGELLEEAQRPLPRGGAVRRWGALAACFCAAALVLALWQPWSGGSGENDAVSDCGAANKSFASTAVEPLSATLTLPEGAELTSGYDLQRGEDGAVTAVSCTVALDGAEYAYSAAYAAGAESGSATLTWESGGLTLLLYDGSVSWYDSASGVEWSLSGEDGEAVLNMAAGIMGTQAFAIPAAPENADDVFYMAFSLEDMAVMEVSFTLGGIRWHYRMAPTSDVSDAIPDISEFSGGALTATDSIRWCPAALRWDEGGAGCIIWRDIVPGLAYSLVADSGATEQLLHDTAALVFQPAQENG